MAAKQSSLERIFILPFVLLLACLASTVTWVLHRSAEEAADTLSSAVLLTSAQHLQGSIRDHFALARVTLNAIAPEFMVPRYVASTEARGEPFALTELQERLWTAMQLFPDSGRRVFFCSRKGQYVSIARIDDLSYEVGMRESGTEIWPVYSSGGPWQVGKTVRKETYDPRTQRWYRLAVNHAREVWYAHPMGAKRNEILITLAKPVYGKDQALLGVASTELSVAGLAQALNARPVSRGGVAFILDRSGHLIASSHGKPVSAGELSKVSFSPGAVAELVQNARAAFASDRSDFARSEAQTKLFDFQSSHGKAQAIAIKLHENGLDWTLIAAAPRSDFDEELGQAAMRNLAVGLFAMALALLFGYLILRRALSDIRRLTAAVKNIGRGEAFHALNIERSDEIGQLAKSFQQIERSLRTDKLTSVLNRDSLIAQIDFHCSVGREVDFLRFTILFIDLDGFKQINDLYGHDEGDRVLSEAAQRLQYAVRKEDAVARFGGDEFVVYLHGVAENGAISAICEKIRVSLETPIDLRQGGSVRVGASIGHASFPDDGVNSDVLLRLADNRMFFDKKMRKSTLQLPLQ